MDFDIRLLAPTVAGEPLLIGDAEGRGAVRMDLPLLSQDRPLAVPEERLEGLDHRLVTASALRAKAVQVLDDAPF